MKIKTLLILIVAAVMIIFAFAGCAGDSESSDTTAAPTDTAVPSLVETDTEDTEDTSDSPGVPEGYTVITENEITNEAGNYIVPIPDSWFNKTAYKLDGTKITIVHLTQDADEYEINPTLVTIDVVPESGEYDGEIFMEIAGESFYYIPLYDLPYSEGSADAEEFSAFYDEIWTVLQSFWTIDESAWQQEIATELGTPFTADDVYFYNDETSNVYIGDAQTGILYLFGDPIEISEVEWEATGEVREIYDYSFGQLVFSGGALVVAQITDTTYLGPRGIEVGMEYNDVAELFASSVEYDDDQMTIYYRANELDDTAFIVPPSGVSYKGDTQTLTFAVFTENSGADEVSAEDLAAGEYMFLEQYDLICVFEDAVMTSFSVRVGTPSE